MKKRIIPFLLILIGLSSLPLQAQKSITLRLNPKQGHTYTINTKASVMNLMEVQGQSMSSTQIMETRQSFSATDVNAQEVTLEGQLEAIKLTVSQMGMTLTYDSEHPEKTSPLIAGQTEEFAEEINKKGTTKLDPLANLISTDRETGMLQLVSATIGLPEEPVQEGSSWTDQKDQEVSGISIHANMTYKVTKISKKSVEIEINGTIEAGEDVSGSYTGTASIDPATGLVINSSLKQNISMTISEQGMSIPLTMTGTTTTTVE